MSRDNQNIKTTDWLTRGMTEEEIAKKKEEAIKEAEAELRDKQIEEMARISCVGFHEGNCENCKSVGICSAYTISKKLYNAGYRKSQEVAREIFEEIENWFDFYSEREYSFAEEETSKGHCTEAEAHDYALDIIKDLRYLCVAELKKKYIGKDTNVTTNKEEGK